MASIEERALLEVSAYSAEKKCLKDSLEGKCDDRCRELSC